MELLLIYVFIIKKIKETVKDPEKARVLTDIDHPFSAKRPPIDSNYFETYNRDNVSIVNLRETPIRSINETGIQTTDAQVDLDMIIFATGYDALTGPLLRLNIEGEAGLPLKDAWKEGPQNYLGLQVPKFPNMFTITGPGSPSVLTNMPVAIEQHVEWITRCIGDMEKSGLNKIEATDHAATEWVQKVNEAANKTLLPKAKHSWYLGANIPGKPRVFMPYAGGLAHYSKICNEVADSNYVGFQRS
jgi:cation diffusion facilitator CzcD-associated flavoprotein CzcO